MEAVHGHSTCDLSAETSRHDRPHYYLCAFFKSVFAKAHDGIGIDFDVNDSGLIIDYRLPHRIFGLARLGHVVTFGATEFCHLVETRIQDMRAYKPIIVELALVCNFRTPATVVHYNAD